MAEKRLLIIDDEPDVGRFIQRVAETGGYQVRVTGCAKEFKEALDSFEPSVICLDVVMPDVDGIELLHYLAEQKCRSRILIVSGHAGRYLEPAGTLGRALGLPAVDTMAKPLELATLRDALGIAA